MGIYEELEWRGLIKDVSDPSIREKLNKGGRLAVITFHSLEDRIIKHAFIDMATGCTCDRTIPVCVCGRTKRVEILTKKPIIASESERENNPRSLSAKLRVIEKL